MVSYKYYYVKPLNICALVKSRSVEVFMAKILEDTRKNIAK